MWSGSWDLRRAQGTAFLDRPGIFAPDVPGCELDVEHRAVNLRMSHQVLQRGQGDAGPHHIRSKGMAEPMRIGARRLAANAMMAK